MLNHAALQQRAFFNSSITGNQRSSYNEKGSSGSGGCVSVFTELGSCSGSHPGVMWPKRWPVQDRQKHFHFQYDKQSCCVANPLHVFGNHQNLEI
jgi:hypothetical protein